MTQQRAPLVTIDGPAGSGKGTASAILADRFDLTLIETGAIYRALALTALREGIALDDEAALAKVALSLPITFRREGGLNRVLLDGEDVTAAIRHEQVAAGASAVAGLPQVRAALLDTQRRLGGRGGAVAEGRDVGTVVFPDAEVKFFLSADEHERARRRVLQLRETGLEADEAEVLAGIRARDQADSGRAVAPLKVPPDAIMIDSTHLGAEEVVEIMAKHLREFEGEATRRYTTERRAMVEQQLIARGIRSKAVLSAMGTVPRHEFLDPSEREAAHGDHPLPIGHGQTISQPYIVAYMTELLELTPTSRVLEIGTGCGYQTAVLAFIAASVKTIEIVPDLARRARAVLDQLGCRNISYRIGDGRHGWPEAAPFDAIIAAAAPPSIPDTLIEQLAPGGRLVLPVGTSTQDIVRLTQTPKGLRRENLIAVRFVPMI